MDETFIYKIDANDHIIHLIDNWSDFARANNGEINCTSPSVLGKSLWDFIANRETRHIYKILIDQVRTKNEEAMFPINCDSPDLKRQIHIGIAPLSDGAIQFSSQIG